MALVVGGRDLFINENMDVIMRAQGKFKEGTAPISETEREQMFQIRY